MQGKFMLKYQFLSKVSLQVQKSEIFLIQDHIFHDIFFIILFYLRYADQVSVGDEVLVQGSDDLKPEKITNVTSFKLQGFLFFSFWTLPKFLLITKVYLH